MKNRRTHSATKWLSTLLFILMLVVNILANTIPIGGVTTGEISARYPNLLTPAPYAFSIWGLIYAWLTLYVLYRWGLFRKNHSDSMETLLYRLDGWFALSCLANIAWVLVWHYDRIPLSIVCMLVLLVSLIAITTYIFKAELTGRDKVFISAPFSIYFGWITVATVLNITILLVSLNWNGFGLPEQLWTVAILLVLTGLGAAVILRRHDALYGLTLLWAYVGILVRHASENGFNLQYPVIVGTICIGLLILVLCTILTIMRKRS